MNPRSLFTVTDLPPRSWFSGWSWQKVACLDGREVLPHITVLLLFYNCIYITIFSQNGHFIFCETYSGPPSPHPLRYELDMISDCCSVFNLEMGSSETQRQLLGAGEVKRAEIGSVRITLCWAIKQNERDKAEGNKTKQMEIILFSLVL